MITAESVKLNQQRMESARGSYDGAWQEIARLVYPEMAHFYGGSLSAWTQRMPQMPAAQMHDPYAAQALEDGVSLFEGFVMPRGQRWQKLALGDDKLMESVRVRQWIEKKEIQLFALRNDPDSGFTSAIHESAMSLQAFAAKRGFKVVPHGLRKNAVIALLEAGCSVAEVSAITGQTLQIVEHYAKARSQRRLSRSAIEKWQGHRA